jgi:hypothetical protein
MALLYITEYADISENVGLEPALVIQTVSFTGTAGTSAAFNENTRYVRLNADANACVLFGTAPTAVTARDTRIAAGAAEYFKVDRGADPVKLKVSAVTTT